jgi:thiamine kinase-like enzyme
MRDGDWFFQGDAAIIVPDMLKSVTCSYQLASGSLDPNSMTDDELVDHCYSPNRNIIHHLEGGITVVRISENIAVKFGYGITEYEANNQQIAHKLVDPTIVRVPFVHRFIQAGEVGYIVMEYVEGTIGDVDPSQIASVIAHFGEIKSSQVGPLAGGYVRGQLWTEDLDFTPTSLQDIESYYNKVLYPQKLKLDGSDIILCHLDIAPRNIISLEGPICLLDWQSAGFYPRVFEYCALRINQQEPGDVNTSLADGFQLTSCEKDQAELILQAWSIFQRYYW